MNINAFLLFSGPKTPIFLLFNLAPILLYMAETLDLVLKVSLTVVYLPSLSSPSSVSQLSDLPVPVPPQHMMF